MLLVNVAFGLNNPMSKRVLAVLSPYTLYFLRVLGATVLFWAVSACMKEERVSKRDLLMLFLAGMAAVVGNQFSFVMGLSLTTPINAAIIITLGPIVTMILAALYQKEPITKKKTAGVFIGASGALLLIVTGMHVGGAGGSLSGNLLCLLSVLSYALYLTAFKNLILKHKAVTLMKWMFLFAAIVSLPFCLNDVEATAWQTINRYDYARIAYIVIIASFATYLCIPFGQKLLRPTTLSMYNYVQPIVTTTVAIVVGIDAFGWNTALAAVLVFAGVYVVTQSKSRSQIEAAKKLQER